MRVTSAILFALLLAFCPVASRAGDEPRRIDFTVVLTDADGNAITECADPEDKECKVKRQVTLGTFAMRALAAPEPNLAQEEALKRGQLALSVYKSSSAQLTVEEIGTIKKLIAKNFSPLVVVRAFAILDPATAQAAK